MTLDSLLQELKKSYEITDFIDLDPWHDQEEHNKKNWLRDLLQSAHKETFADNQRVVFTLTRGDVYADEQSSVGSLIIEFQRRLNEIDISNFFVVLLTNDDSMIDAYHNHYKEFSSDPIPFTIMHFGSNSKPKQIQKQIRNYGNYADTTPLTVALEDLSEQEKFFLTESKTFCIYPWIHFHAYPTGSAYPCCMADMQFPIGDMRKHTIREIWNQAPMREMRRRMINNQPISACNRCYEQENAGFVSGRQSANKHHGHHIDRVKNTKTDGGLDQFELTYWDIRFSNLCNLRCRSCGHIFSSQWYQDQAKLAGPKWRSEHTPLNYAGRFETDAWDQLVEHIDHVEQIYFAGGEPLLMEEHYRILDELDRREMYHVRLIYNTNFTHTDLKGRSVFDYWRKFNSVSVGASLDGSGSYAEYIRKGTTWKDIEANRVEMIKVCPNVDFYISPTLSIMNAWHLPDFHRDWVERGLIRHQDLNVNILQDPPYYRIDIATPEYKQQLSDRFQKHIQWLKSAGDPLGRVTSGFEAAIKFMNATDNTHLIEQFWKKTQELDTIRNEKILDVIPELKVLMV
jgi:organic radical activating enzyme